MTRKIIIKTARWSSVLALSLLLSGMSVASALAGSKNEDASKIMPQMQPQHRTVSVDGVEVFYREAGPKNAPVVLLLHGFPTSSHMYRNLMNGLSDTYRVIAPDLPGFGFSEAPDRESFSYTFAHLTDVMDGFTKTLGLKNYAIFVFDYGAPVGFRLALRHPDKITAIISQNGNAYAEGLNEGFDPIKTYWNAPTQKNRDALRGFLTADTTKWQYTFGVESPENIAPETYTLDAMLMARPGNNEIQLDLFLDYASNVALYPEFQKYFRKHQPPLLAVWGKNDPFFLPAGARGFARDLPNAQIHFFDTGHFALETHNAEITTIVRAFLKQKIKP